MSRSNPQDGKSKNPASLFLRWKSEKKAWMYWDKDAKEEKLIDMGVPFIVLDMLSTVTGFNEKLNAGLWANEVRNTKTQSIVLHAGDKEVARGLWEDVKSVSGAKFAKSVYAMAKLDGKYQLVNFKMSGCSLGPWFDFVESVGGEHVIYGDTVCCVGDTVEGKKGRNVYNSPVFVVATHDLTEDAKAEALKMDETLQKYLKAYFDAGKTTEQNSTHTGGGEPDQGAPDEEPDKIPVGDENVPF